MSKVIPTAEQELIIEAVKSGNHVNINASAGAGKSTSLFMAATVTPEKTGLYTTFTKSMVVDADTKLKKSAPHVSARTMHSLAFGAEGIPFKDRIFNRRRQSNAEIVEILAKMSPKTVKTMIGECGGVNTFANFFKYTLKNFSKSADSEVSINHIPDTWKTIFSGSDQVVSDALTNVLIALTNQAWDRDICDPEGKLKFEQDYYLKMYQLNQPYISAKVIYFDECQPEGTKVAVLNDKKEDQKFNTYKYVPIETLKPGNKVLSYDRSGVRLRSKGSELSDVRSRDWSGDLVVVTTTSGKTSKYTPDHKCLATLGPALKDKYVLYLMRKDNSYRIGVTDGLNKSTGNAGFRMRLQEERGDGIWILGIYSTRESANFQEAYISWKFGIPDLRFFDVRQQEKLDEFWGKVGDLTTNAKECLEYFGRMIEHPIYEKAFDKKSTLISRPMLIRACNLFDGALVIDVDGMLKHSNERKQLDGARDEKSIVVTREPYTGKIWTLEVSGDHTYVADGIVTHNCQDSDSVMLDIILQQAKYGTQIVFVGDTYQRLFAWRGSVDGAEELRKIGAIDRYLTKSWRFGPEIAAEANKWLKALKSVYEITGNERVKSSVVGLGSIESPSVVLCRTNGGLLTEAVATIDKGKKFSVPGGSNKLIPLKMLAKGAQDLKLGYPTDCPELFGYKNWKEVEAMPSEELISFVRLVNRVGTQKIINACNSATLNETDADVLLSTVHSAKGLEWPKVRVSDDFWSPKPDFAPNKFELMVGYVGVTRAINEIDLGLPHGEGNRGGLTYVDKILEK